jgi:hypothetical protein
LAGGKSVIFDGAVFGKPLTNWSPFFQNFEEIKFPSNEIQK